MMPKSILLAAATLPAAFASPAAAQPSPVTVVEAPGPAGSSPGRRFRRVVDNTVVVYDRADNGDSAFRRDGFNDWWHSDPARAFPRWMSNNQGCQRQWWSGGGWTC